MHSELNSFCTPEKKGFKLQHITFHCMCIEKLHLMKTKIKGRSHYNCSWRPNFMATEHTWDETVLAQMPGHRQWVFLFCPLKFDSTGYEPPVRAHSPVCELLPFTEVVSSGFREQKGVCLKTYCSLPTLHILSTANPDLWVFLEKLKKCSIWHAANPLQPLTVAGVRGADTAGWFAPSPAPARPEHCRSLQGHGAASKPWGPAWLGRGWSSGRGQAAPGISLGRRKGEVRPSSRGRKVRDWISSII